MPWAYGLLVFRTLARVASNILVFFLQDRSTPSAPNHSVRVRFDTGEEIVVGDSDDEDDVTFAGAVVTGPPAAVVGPPAAAAN